MIPTLPKKEVKINKNKSENISRVKVLILGLIDWLEMMVSVNTAFFKTVELAQPSIMFIPSDTVYVFPLEFSKSIRTKLLIFMKIIW